VKGAGWLPGVRFVIEGVRCGCRWVSVFPVKVWVQEGGHGLVVFEAGGGWGSVPACRGTEVCLWDGSIPQLYSGVVWWSGWGWPHLYQAMAGFGEVFGDGVPGNF